MSLENVQDELAAERSPVALHVVAHYAGGVTGTRKNVVAFKFGGSSLFGAKRMLHSAGLVHAAAQSSSVIVVVSAMKGVTDHLLSIARPLAAGKFARSRREADIILDFHLQVLHDLQLEKDSDLRVCRELQFLGRDLLHEASAHGQVGAGDELHDRLASFGERLSSRLFAAALGKLGVSAVPVVSSDFVLTCGTFRNAQPHREQTRQRGRDILLPLLEEGIVPVVTGFIGATPDGRITTLGRNSSDFSGALIAHTVDADELVIWTDVDGIYTANPRGSAEARLLHELSYKEAHALAASGAKVLHEKVLPLAAETEMVVWVRNTFNPQARGTRIGSPQASKVPVSKYSASVPQGGAA
jgi:aspartokinase/homoserine dehydrogenase 1